MLRILSVFLCFVFLSSCTIYDRYQLDKEYGKAHPIDRQQTADGQFSYWNDVQPVLENRCVVCHGCYDAPCQLKMSAFEGLDRGASSEKVYVGARLVAAKLTRLFEDGNNLDEWREKSFYPVLNEREQTPEANKEGSVMYQMMALKKEHPLVTDNQVLPDTFDFALDPKLSCPKIEEFHTYAEEFPGWGMPYALPGLSHREFNVVASWIEDGAPYREKQWVSTEDQSHIETWERFFNQDSLKHQLSSRYLYEHLFLSHLYFDKGVESDKSGPTQYYRLVRSVTPAPEPVQQIATRRPYDDPEVERVYYRLQPIKTTILDKTHMPYLLDATRMAKWQEWFIDADYEIDSLPSYKPEVASNPFIAFNALPQNSRYRFLLDEAQHTIMGFIKGPVCRGQVALNVIDDHFWVVFIEPDNELAVNTQKFLFEHSNLLRFPAEKESNAGIIRNWRLFSGLQKEYLEAKTQYINSSSNGVEHLGLDYIWDGNGNNDNYALTVLRHFDSATVAKGFVGDTPKTAWLIDYSLLERIHYLLVAGFDVYGNAGHQLNTRLYMDFLRMEGEFNFLAFMPKEKRENMRDFWYREASEETKNFVYGSRAHFEKPTGIKFKSDDPMTEFFKMVQARSTKNTNYRYDMDHADVPYSLRRTMKKLNSLKGKSYSFLPSLTFIRVKDNDKNYFFTLIKNEGHYNVTHVFKESEMLVPEEDYLLVVPGLLGSYPNRFFDIDIKQAKEFVEDITLLSSESDYRRLGDRFAVRRSSPRFWAFSDNLHRTAKELAPIEGGLFDFNRLENR